MLVETSVCATLFTSRTTQDFERDACDTRQVRLGKKEGVLEHMLSGMGLFWMGLPLTLVIPTTRSSTCVTAPPYIRQTF